MNIRTFDYRVCSVVGVGEIRYGQFCFDSVQSAVAFAEMVLRDDPRVTGAWVEHRDGTATATAVEGVGEKRYRC